MERESETEEAALDPAQLVNLAETHLRLRNISLSRQYSLELLSSDPTSRSLRAAATQILTVSDILSATSNTTAAAVNHYSVLQIDSFSTDPNLIRAHYKKLFFILDPIKNTLPFAQNALDSVQKAFACLSDPVKKAVFDTELRNTMSGLVGGANGNAIGGFWTFCPYCFYVYEYDRVYEGCCLRCQNLGCRRVFHGIALTSLPKMELDKGRYFGCFGYFPLGFSPAKEGDDEMGKFQAWSPFVGMFPAKRRKAPAGRMDMNDDDDDDVHVNGNGNGNCNLNGDGKDYIMILSESDESDAGDKGENSEGNVPTGVPIVDRDRPRGMRRKSVAVNARRKRRGNVGAAAVVNGSGDRLVSDEDVDLIEEFGLENDHAVGPGGGGIVDDLNEVDMAFFEEGGEIFVGLGDDYAP